MRQEIVIKSMLRRVSVPSNLLMVGLVGGMFCLFRLVSRNPATALSDCLLPFVLLFGHLALSPLPWQWTGDDRVWVGLVLFSLRLLGVPPGPRPPMPFPSMPPPMPFPSMPPAGHGPPFGFGVALGLVNLAFGIAFGWVCAAKEATEASGQRTADLLRQAQARALQNQLEPHVLYNALNGLAELVQLRPLEVLRRLRAKKAKRRS